MLSTSVLVLNRLYQPVHVTSVRRAIILLYRGAAKAVDEQYQTFDFESWAELAVAIHEESIGTSSRRLRVPRVILLQAYDHLPRAKVRFSRLNIYARDRNTCQYCGRTPDEAHLKLLRAPVRPRWTPFFRGPPRTGRFYSQWLPFLNTADLAYWNVELASE